MLFSLFITKMQNAVYIIEEMGAIKFSDGLMMQLLSIFYDSKREI